MNITAQPSHFQPKVIAYDYPSQTPKTVPVLVHIQSLKSLGKVVMLNSHPVEVCFQLIQRDGPCMICIHLAWAKLPDFWRFRNGDGTDTSEV